MSMLELPSRPQPHMAFGLHGESLVLCMGSREWEWGVAFESGGPGIWPHWPCTMGFK
jgi:hypothetical protein